MEYRAWISIPGLRLGDAQEWEPFISGFERDSPYGPSLGFEQGVARIVVSMDADDASTAARMLYDAVAEALCRYGLPHLYPSEIHLEPTGDAEPVAA